MSTAKKQNCGTTGTEAAVQKFKKEQIITSARYGNQRDLVEALLTDGKTYSIADVDNMIEKYRKGQVK